MAAGWCSPGGRRSPWSRRDAERLAIYEDRECIARDLHDLAIQRLFASGMTLPGVQRLVQGHPGAAERLARTVGDLDTTVKIIRSAIFGLRMREEGPERQGLRGRAATTVEAATASLGFTPALRMEGLRDREVPEAVVDHVSAVVAKVLSNVARHVDASAVDVHLVAGGGELVLTVTDDGVGIPEDVTLSGLANMEDRTVELGGGLVLEEPPGGGTRLRWRVPLSAPAADGIPVWAMARWCAPDGTARTGLTKVPADASAGAPVTAWTDQRGGLTPHRSREEARVQAALVDVLAVQGAAGAVPAVRRRPYQQLWRVGNVNGAGCPLVWTVGLSPRLAVPS